MLEERKQKASLLTIIYSSLGENNWDKQQGHSGEKLIYDGDNIWGDTWDIYGWDIYGCGKWNIWRQLRHSGEDPTSYGEDNLGTTLLDFIFSLLFSLIE